MMQIAMGLMLTLLVVFVFMFFYFLKIWVRALASGAYVSVVKLLGMKLRNIPPTTIVDARIMAKKAGL